MPLVAFSIKLDKIDEESALSRPRTAPTGCRAFAFSIPTPKAGRSSRRSIPKERYAAGEKGRDRLGYWRELGGRPIRQPAGGQRLRPGQIQGSGCRSAQATAAGRIPAGRGITPASAARVATTGRKAGELWIFEPVERQ